MNEFDLHGIRHADVGYELENWCFQHTPPFNIITGNSQKMKDLAITFLNKHKYKYFVGDLQNNFNYGVISVL